LTYTALATLELVGYELDDAAWERAVEFVVSRQIDGGF